MSDEYSAALIEFFDRLSSWEESVVADREVSLPQMHLLEVVGTKGSIRMSELSQRLGVTTGTLTVMAHRLESRGYIIRRRDEKDKRVYQVELTEKGRREYENHHHLHEHLIENIVDYVGEQRAKQLFSLLKEAGRAFVL